MPTCPECGHTESTVGVWILTGEGGPWAPLESKPVEGDDGGDYALVVCPSCDVVLGGGGWAWAHDALV